MRACKQMTGKAPAMGPVDQTCLKARNDTAELLNRFWLENWTK